MKTIHLMESGDFLLGIEPSLMISVMTLEQFLQEQPGTECDLIAPESLFRHRNHRVQPLDYLLVRISENVDYPFLLFDRERGEVRGETVHDFPALYPDKARLCCPEAIIRGEETILVLDPAGFIQMYSELSSPDDFLLCAKDIPAEKERIKAATPAKTKPVPLAGDQRKPEMLPSGADQQPPPPSSSVQDETANSSKTPGTQENDPVHQIITWIAGEFDTLISRGKTTLQPSDIPQVLVDKAALDKKTLRYLVRETTARLKRARKKQP